MTNIQLSALCYAENGKPPALNDIKLTMAL